MRLIPLLFIVALLMPITPMQEPKVSVNIIAGLSLSDTSVEPNATVILALFVNVSIRYNDTPAEYNGSIEIDVALKIPEGINVTSLSTGNFTNSTIKATRYNQTYATLYAKLLPRKEGTYRLNAMVNVTSKIYVNANNDTIFYNKTDTANTNFVTLKVYHKSPKKQEERNRISIYESLRKRYFQVFIALFLIGFILSNAISDMKARRKRKK